MKRQPIKDHLGQEFPSITQLCKHWNISRKTFIRHYNANGNIKNIIENLNDSQNNNQCTDHLGNTFKSTTDMCKHYNITISAYKHRKNKGWTLEEILSTKQNNTIIFDHNGNKFNSIQSMCDFHNINKNTYANRRRRGVSLKDALTIPAKNVPKVNDHLGNTFKSITAMCEHYNISISTYKRRLNYNYTLQEALTKPVYHKETAILIDPFGNTFDSVTTLCQYYQISSTKYYGYLNKHYSQLEALQIIPRLHTRINNKQITTQLTIKKHIENNYYLCILNSNDIILHRNNIIQYATQYYSQIYKVEKEQRK